MSIGPEKYDHDRIQESLKQLGWIPLPNFQPRQKIENHILQDHLTEALYALNQEFFNNLDPQQKSRVVEQTCQQIECATTSQMLHYLKYGTPLTMQQGIPQQRVKLIHWDAWENNTFYYAHEAKFPGYPQASIPDFTLFVNGIPLVIIEAKRTRGIEEETEQYALSQIATYEQRSPQLFTYVQIGIAYGTQQVYIPTWSPYEENYLRRMPQAWKPYKPESNQYEEDDNIFVLLEPQTLLKIIRHYTFIGYENLKKGQNSQENGRIYRLIPRYMQYYAVEKAMQRIKGYLSNSRQQEQKNRGLIWHWQGSGKTFEIYPFLAIQFMEQFRNRNPHLFIIVDRKELEDQIWYRYIQSIEVNSPISFSLNLISSIQELKKILRLIKNQETNPALTGATINLVLLHKFRENELKSIKPITKREILILRDEVHRTEHGKLAEVLYSKFPNALRFGFTGTPLLRNNKQTKNIGSTFEEYGYPEEKELYLDCYFIADSIKDGCTLPLLWRQVKEEDIRIPDQEQIRKIVEEIVREEIEVSEDDVHVSLKDLLLAENRIKCAAKYIAQHILEDTEEFKFKTFVVAQSRYVAVLFHKYLSHAMKKEFPDQFNDEWIQVVMTGQGGLKNPSWESTIQNFIQEETNKYGKSWDELVNERKRKFAQPNSEPRILIVSDMLLQGYDAPILKVMYLYKILGSTRLLQTITRTNRPITLTSTKDYKISKKLGLIVDLTGILWQVFCHSIQTYNLFASRKIQDDLLVHIFKNVDTRWKEFLHEFQNTQEIINSALADISWNFDKLKNQWNQMPDDSKNLILSFLSQRNQHPTALEIINELHRTIRSFESIGVYAHKVEYYDDYELMVALLHDLKTRFFGKKETHKSTIIHITKQKSMEKIQVSPLENMVKETMITNEYLNNLSPLLKCRIEIDNLLHIAHEKLNEKSRKGPLYKILHEKLTKIRETFLFSHEEGENENALSTLKDQAESLLKDIEKVDIETKQTSLAHQIVKSVLNQHLTDIHLPDQKRHLLDEKLTALIQNIIRQKRQIKPTDIQKITSCLLEILPEDVPVPGETIAQNIAESIEEMINEYAYENR